MSPTVTATGTIFDMRSTVDSPTGSSTENEDNATSGITHGICPACLSGKTRCHVVPDTADRDRAADGSVSPNHSSLRNAGSHQSSPV